MIDRDGMSGERRAPKGSIEARVLVSMSAEMLDETRDRAMHEGVTRSEWIRGAVRLRLSVCGKERGDGYCRRRRRHRGVCRG